MEVLYLLLSIVTATITSLFLSVPLLLHLSRKHVSGDGPALYEGTVRHERRRPVHHAFHYPVRYALFDLDRSVPPPDHLSADCARAAAGTTGPVHLLTVPPSVGYVQNPLSVYYCYDLDGSTQQLKKCIAEVTNTPWGERVTFIFHPFLDQVAKPLHVSPFMDMQGTWNIKTNAPGSTLSVVISVQHPELGDYFVATLKAKRTSSSDEAMFFWLMPHKIALSIYWQALKLWWKKVEFIQHPRYNNHSYKEDALARDGKLQCSRAMDLMKRKCSGAEGTEPVALEDCFNDDDDDDDELIEHVDLGNNYSRQRWIKWRDAKWPWC